LKTVAAKNGGDTGVVSLHRAKWVVPMAAPVIADGAVAVADGRILAVGPAAAVRAQCRTYGGRVLCHDHGDGAIIPALVNTHVHLEFTALAGAIPPQDNLPAWLAAAMAGYASLAPADVAGSVAQGLAELRRCGTILVGEVSNTGQSLPLLAASGLAYHYFYECLGFDVLHDGPLEDDFPFLARPEVAELPVSAAAHAPYSVAAPLCRRLAAWNWARRRPNAVHLAESPEELQFLQQGDGPLRELLKARGRWYEGYTPPGCSPAVYLEQLGFWQESDLAVHGVWLTEADRAILARRGVFLALCPRSNRHTGVGLPDVTALLRAGVRLTLGTDSLASTPDLNLFREMQTLHAHHPEVPVAALLAMATGNGAQALGRQADLGSISPGKRAALLFLPIPSARHLWPGLLAAGAAGEIYWLTPAGKEICHGI